ncbi:MAG: helicase, partial [Flavobacteriales bacterium]|nr:helicase [Flavobacteriales bacterium]
MSNTKFIDNGPEETLQDRFALRIKNTQSFDVLSGYFYSSGFKAIYPSLENTKKIRILVGISTDYKTLEAVKSAKELSSTEKEKEVRKEYASSVKKELEEAEDSLETEESVSKFKEWVISERIEIRAYPDQKIHSKVYIMTADEQTKSFTKGTVITGSSNFTESGLRGNIEFNVELKDEADYDYALGQFEELWKKGVPISDQYVQTINHETWLNDRVTPYELYLKFLYEYFREELNENATLTNSNRPPNFKPLQYQEDAVINAKRIINKHKGVFISDVVGLGKTYMGTMLCQELGGKTLVIAPPNLIDETNPGSWRKAFEEFNFSLKDCRFRSKGVLDQIAEKGEFKGYDNIIIDEAHTYRNESTETYGHLSRICKDKRVILITATPYNNKLDDLLAQIKLFQGLTNSTIPNLPNIANFFRELNLNLKGLSYKEDPNEYSKVTEQNAKLARIKLLKHIMVRRTRNEIQDSYSDDLIKQNIIFPDVLAPIPIYCEFDSNENKVFVNTIELLKSFKYARYRPINYLKKVNHLKAEKNRENQISAFMKILLVKRLESSFWAFKKTIDRFIEYYESFIKQYYSGQIIVSKENYEKIKQYISDGNLDEVKKLIEDGKGELYKSVDFNDKFIDDLKEDREKLIQIKNDWESIKTDSKLMQFKKELEEDKNLINNKKIIFTESKETCDYLQKELKDFYRVINFSGSSSRNQRSDVIHNFDAGV